jgi:hypothetical protein
MVRAPRALLLKSFAAELLALACYRRRLRTNALELSEPKEDC